VVRHEVCVAERRHLHTGRAVDCECEQLDVHGADNDCILDDDDDDGSDDDSDSDDHNRADDCFFVDACAVAVNSCDDQCCCIYFERFADDRAGSWHPDSGARARRRGRRVVRLPQASTVICIGWVATS